MFIPASGSYNVINKVQGKLFKIEIDETIVVNHTLHDFLYLKKKI